MEKGNDVREPSFDSAAVTLSMSRVPPCNLINSCSSQLLQGPLDETYLDKSQTDTSTLVRSRNRSHTMEPFTDKINIGSYTSDTIVIGEQRRTRDTDTTVLDSQDRFVWPVRHLDMYESGIS